jgi:hypothetical protein
MALSKHVTHYGQLWGFLYYNLTTPLRRIQLQGCTEQLCGFEPWKPSPVPTKDILKMNILIFNDDCKIFTEIIIILTLPFVFKHLHWTVLIQFLLQCKSLELGPMVIYIYRDKTLHFWGSWKLGSLSNIGPAT